MGKNASDTCVMLSKAYGREAMEKLSPFGWHNSSVKVGWHVEITNEGNTHHFL
jgi:hypothetical protein